MPDEEIISELDHHTKRLVSIFYIPIYLFLNRTKMYILHACYWLFQTFASLKLVFNKCALMITRRWTYCGSKLFFSWLVFVSLDTSNMIRTWFQFLLIDVPEGIRMWSFRAYLETGMENIFVEGKGQASVFKLKIHISQCLLIVVKSDGPMCNLHNVLFIIHFLLDGSYLKVFLNKNFNLNLYLLTC